MIQEFNNFCKEDSNNITITDDKVMDSCFNFKEHKCWKHYINLNLLTFIEKQYIKTINDDIIYPPQNLIFNAFKLTPFDKINIVILGQDPYHNPNQANGLAFSVNKNQKIPPSLRNIYKLLNKDSNLIEKDLKTKKFIEPTHGDLSHWAKQGVFLLNSALTVYKNKPNSHAELWRNFTDNIIKTISDKKSNIVFILWGKYAQSKIKFIDMSKHFVITSSHPSPYSASYGFFDSQSFYKATKYIYDTKKIIIDWNL